MSVSSIAFNCNDIAAIIRSLDPNKDHDNDVINIRMTKICGKLICKLVELIFQSCIKQRKFPNEFKTKSVVPVHTKK